MYVQNNACHQRKTNQGNTWRRTALTTVSFRKSLQIDRNQSGKKPPIIYIHLPGNWENEVVKQKPNKIKTINNTNNNNTTAMQNKLDFGGIGFNVMLAKASLKCTIFVRSNWNTVKFVLVYCIISYIFCVVDYTVSLNMLKWSSTGQRTYKHLFVVQVYMHYS